MLLLEKTTIITFVYCHNPIIAPYQPLPQKISDARYPPIPLKMKRQLSIGTSGFKTLKNKAEIFCLHHDGQLELSKSWSDLWIGACAVQ